MKYAYLSTNKDSVAVFYSDHLVDINTLSVSSFAKRSDLTLYRIDPESMSLARVIEGPSIDDFKFVRVMAMAEVRAFKERLMGTLKHESDQITLYDPAIESKIGSFDRQQTNARAYFCFIISLDDFIYLRQIPPSDPKVGRSNFINTLNGILALA